MDIPNILKQRKQLAKLVLDYDSARARFVQTSLSPCVSDDLSRPHGKEKKQPEVKVLKTFAIMIMCFFFTLTFQTQMVAGDQVNNLRDKHSSTDGQS